LLLNLVVQKANYTIDDELIQLLSNSALMTRARAHTHMHTSSRVLLSRGDGGVSIHPCPVMSHDNFLRIPPSIGGGGGGGLLI